MKFAFIYLARIKYPSQIMAKTRKKDEIVDCAALISIRIIFHVEILDFRAHIDRFSIGSHDQCETEQHN